MFHNLTWQSMETLKYNNSKTRLNQIDTSGLWSLLVKWGEPTKSLEIKVSRSTLKQVTLYNLLGNWYKLGRAAAVTFDNHVDKICFKCIWTRKSKVLIAKRRRLYIYIYIFIYNREIPLSVSGLTGAKGQLSRPLKDGERLWCHNKKIHVNWSEI